MYVQGHSRLVSVGTYIPEQRVTSEEIMREVDSLRFDVPHRWLEKATGVKERRAAPSELAPSDMAVKAALEALEVAQLSADQIDTIIYVGIDRDVLEPATAHMVQAKLGARNALVFDLTNACHGFINGLHMMDAMIALGQTRRGLIVTGERGFRYARNAIATLKDTDSQEVFFRLAAGLTLGDAGGAAILGPKLDPETGFMGFMLESYGDYHGLSMCRNGENRCLETESTLIADGTRLLGDLYTRFIDKLGWKASEVAKCVQHQPTRKLAHYIAAFSQIPLDRSIDTISTLGNVVTANIPVSLQAAAKCLTTREKVLISGAGSGLVVSHTGLVWDSIRAAA